MMRALTVFTAALFLMTVTPAFAQYDNPPMLPPGELDNLVGRIALYPDPLLAQVLTAATFPDQIPDAARYADDHANLRGDELANTIAQDNLPWDPSVQALLPFPSVLDTLAQDMNWTSRLGNAVLAQRPDVMDAVQRMRRQAERYGYLQTNSQIRVVDQPQYVEILPVNPAFLYVPIYDPFIVYAPPRPGFFVGGAIGFSNGFVLGSAFGSWGWGGRFDWYAHNVYFNNVVWGRTWVNRTTYVHNWGNWNGGRWAHYAPTRNVTINNNVNVNRNTTFNNNVQNNRNVYHGNQPYTVAPNRGYERHEPEHSGAFHGTENGRAERGAAQWGRESRGTPQRGHR
jgi:hypothetical protein